jgi:hypothetical protein
LLLILLIAGDIEIEKGIWGLHSGVTGRFEPKSETQEINNNQRDEQGEDDRYRAFCCLKEENKAGSHQASKASSARKSRCSDSIKVTCILLENTAHRGGDRSKEMKGMRQIRGKETFPQSWMLPQ